MPSPRHALLVALIAAALPAVGCGAGGPIPDPEPEVATPGDPHDAADAWCVAFRAGDRPAVPDDDERAAAMFPELLSCGVGPAVAFVEAAGAERLGESALGRAVSRALDVYLYRLGYRGDATEQRHVIAAFRPALGDAFVLRKHAVVAALTQERADATADLERLADGDPEVVAALAFEFSTRGAQVAAGAAWRHAAAIAGDGRTAGWMRHAADADYALGRTEGARRALDASVAAAEDPVAAWGAAHDVARRRGDTGYLPAGVSDATGLACTPDTEERVAAAELVMARHEVDGGEVVGAARRLRERVDTGCGVATLGAAGGLLLLEAGREDLAVPLLHAAVIARPRDIDLATALFGAIDVSHADAAREAAGVVLSPMLADPAAVTPHTALTVAEALASAGTRTGLQNLIDGAAALLDAVGDARPENFDVAVARVTPPVGALDLGVFDAYVAASPDPTIAALAVGHWLERRQGRSDAAAAWFVALAARPEAAVPVDALGGLRADAHAWLRAATLLAGLGRADEARDAIEGYLDASGADAARWERLFDAEAVERLPPEMRADLARRAVAAGEVSVDVLLTLGAATLALGDRDEAADAYARLVIVDPPMVPGLVDRLSRTGAHDVLALALERAAEVVRTPEVQLALGVAYARLAARAGAEPARQVHRATARRALLAALEQGAGWADIERSTLRDAGLFDLAAARSEWRLGALGADPSVALETAIDFADAGLPESRVMDTVGGVLPELDADALGQVRVRFAAAGYPRAALAVGERELERYTGSPEAFAATVSAVVGLAIWADDRDAVRRLVQRHLVEPARALGTVTMAVPERYRRVEDRALAAANLLREASRLYFVAAMWAAASDLALEALGFDDSNPTVLLPRAVIARLRATGGALTFDGVEALAAHGGGDAFAWRLTAFTLQDAQRWELAARAWERALALAPDDWAAGGQLGRVLAVLDRPDEAYDVLAHACGTARALEGSRAEGELAVLGAQALRDAGRLDLAVRLLSDRPDAQARIALAEALEVSGRAPDALRLVETSTMPAATEVALLADAGLAERAARAWHDRAAAIAPTETLALLRDYAELLFAHLQPAEVEETVHDGLGSGWHPADIDMWLAREYAARGRFLAAAVLLERHLAALSDDDRLYVAALFHAAGAADAAQEVVATIGRSPFGTVEADDRALPAQALTEVLVRYDRPGDVLGALDDLAAVHPAPVWTGMHRATVLLALGDATGAMDLAAELVDGLSIRPAGPATDDRLHRRMGRGLAGLAIAGFARESGALAERALTLTGDPVFAHVAAGAYAHGQADADLLGAVRRLDELLTGELSALAAGCLELARARLGDEATRCFAALAGPAPYDVRVDVLVAAWRASLVGDLPALADVALAQVDSRIEPGDIAAAAVSGYDFGVAAEMRDGRRFEDDDGVVAAFGALYVAGDVAGALERIEDAVRVADRPADLVERALALVHPSVDAEAARRLALLAIRLAPGDTWAQVRAYALGAADDSWVHGRVCGGGPVADILTALAEVASAEVVVTVADVARACGQLPSGTLPGYAVALGRAGRIDEAMDVAVEASLVAAPRAVEAAARAAVEASLPAVALALVGRGPEGGVLAALRARSLAGTDDIGGASEAVERWLRAPSPMDVDGPGLIADLAAAGAYGLADRVAEAVYRLPPAWPEVTVGGWELVADGYGAGDPTAGVRWFETRHPQAAVVPALAGAAVAHATLLERAGDVDGAVAVYDQALELAPDSPVLRNNLAYVLAVHGRDLERAEGLARSALAGADAPDAGYLDTLGWVLHRRGRHREARTLIETALRLLPSEGGFHPASESSRVLLGHLAEVDLWLTSVEPSGAGELPRGRRHRERRR